MVFKPVGVDENGKFPARVTTALNATYVPNSAKGAASGVATLDSAGKSVEERLYVAHSARPQKPRIETMIERFAAGHSWAINGNTPAATAADDTTDFALGTQSFKFTTKTDGSAGSVQRTGMSLDLTGKQLVFWVKVVGSANITELIVYAGDTSLANNYSWTIGDNGGTEQQVWREGQWTRLVLGFNDGQATGSPNRANIQTLRVRARATNTNVVTVNLGGFGTTPEPNAFPNGVITIGCDDSYISQFNIMRPILDAKGWGATAFQIVEFVGTNGFCSLNQLKSLERDSGWEIAGHSFTNTMHSNGFGSLSTPAEVETDLRALRKWLLDNKFRGADHLAYPRGYFSATNEEIVGKYFATARTVINRMTETIRPSDRLRLRSLSVSSGTTLATAKAFVDKTKAGKGWGILTIHDLIATPSTGTQWPTADFQALVDYIAAAGIPVMTMSEVVNRLNTPEIVSDLAPVVTQTVAQANTNMGAIVHAALGNGPNNLHCLPREQAGSGIATLSGRADVVCFTPTITRSWTRLMARTSGTAWTGHTLARMGLYTVDAAGAMTLVAQTAADATLFVAPNTAYQRTFDTAGGFPASYTMQAGQRYAVGIIGVGQTAGQLRGQSSIFPERAQIMGGTVGSGLTDLPTSGTITASGTYPYAEIAA